MATNVTVKDLDNYPDISKTVTVDQTTIVPTGAGGDEKWVLSFTTNGYSDNVNRTAIQDIYVQDIKVGWAKSSGFVSGPFVITSGTKTLGLSIDGSNTYYVELTDGTYGGDSLATELETKIRAVPTISGSWNSNDDVLAFKNAVVEFKNGKFYIVSGNIAAYYTGPTKTSVSVTASGSDTLYSYLGFNLGYDSETITSTAIKESILASSYTAGSSSVVIASSIDAVVGDALVITDGINTDYFTALSVTNDVTIGVAVSGTNGFDGISHNYTAGSSKVQVLRAQDPDAEAQYYYKQVDDIVRWGIMSIANQLDFSS